METPNAKIMRILCYSQMFVMSALVICLEFDATLLIPFTCIFATFVCLVEIVVEDVRILNARVSANAKLTNANVETLGKSANTNMKCTLNLMRQAGLQLDVAEVQATARFIPED